MISFKTYVKVLLSIIGMIFISVLFVDLLQDPLNGDLTRIGKFSENDYGWNKPSSKLAGEPNLKGKINQHYDVIILGDSFSHEPSSWSKILSLSTNLNIGQFHTNQYPNVFEFINILKSNNNLPKVFIYESVERALKSRLKKFNECPTQNIQYSNISAIEYSIMDLMEVPYLRNSKQRVDDVGFTLQYIKANLWDNHGKVNKFKLNKSFIFSNLKSDKILVYSDDLITTSWTNEDQIQEWTRAVTTGDLDDDGDREVIVGDYDNNIYVFEHLSNNTYKRAFKSHNLNHSESTTLSPYLCEELAGIEGDFTRGSKFIILFEFAEPPNINVLMNRINLNINP